MKGEEYWNIYIFLECGPLRNLTWTYSTICFQDFKFRQVLWSFFCGPKPHFLRNNTLAHKYIPKIGKVDAAISNNMVTSNFTNVVDVTTNGSPDSENKVLQTDF